MNKLFAIILVFFVSTTLLAQLNNDFFQDTTDRVSVNLGTSYTYGSNTINNEFMGKFLFGGKIEQELKESVYSKLVGNNFTGGDLNYAVNVFIPLDSFLRKTNLSLVLGVENVEHVDASFTEDLFRFTFDGNKQFAGRSADIEGTNFNSFIYQQVNLGLIAKRVKNKRLATEGVIVSLIKAQSHEAITIPRGTIFTEQLGKELIVDANYEYNSSDTANTGLKAFNGYGLSTDLFTSFFLKNGDKIRLEMSDFGFMVLNNNSIQQKGDSVYSFEGVEVDNIFDLNDSLLAEISRDSIIDDISEEKQGRYTVALPMGFNVNYSKYFNDKWRLDVGVYYKMLANYFPLVYTNTYYYFNDSFAIKGHVSFGGYGKLNTGLAFAKSFKKNLNVHIGTNNIEAFVARGSSYASSGFAGLTVYF